MASRPKSTLGDSLPAETLQRLAQLREKLELRARETVKAQLERPKAPWQLRPLPQKPNGRAASMLAVRKTTPVTPRKPGAAQAAAKRARAPAVGQSPSPRRPAPEAQPAVTPFSYWELPPEASVRDPAPTEISAIHRISFEQIIQASSALSKSARGEYLFGTIGVDFGTSATKVIVRFPYEPGEPAIAIPAPQHCRSMGHAYLWQTVLWLDENGEFRPWPVAKGALLYSLKQGIMGAHADAPIVSGGNARTNTITKTDAAAAYLSYVIQYVRGWLAINRPQIFLQRRPVWFVNLGLPAASADHDDLLSAYRRVAAAGLLCANSHEEVTVELIHRFLTDSNVLNAARSATAAESLGIGIIPEAAAEAVGFAKSRSSAPGLYLMIDVGAMTLDVCAFRLTQKPSEDDLYALVLADVRPLGIEAYYWFLGAGKTEPGFVEQCERCLHRVVWRTKSERDPYADAWKRGRDLPVFILGGGAQNRLHQEIISALGPWLRHQVENEGIRLLDLPIPATVDLPIPIADFNRLAVAWGLSYAPSEIGQIFLPSECEDVPPLPHRDDIGHFISKDQV